MSYLFSSDNYHLELEAGKVRWLHNDVRNKLTFYAVSDAVIAAKNWTHIAVTYNTTDNVAMIYINGYDSGSARGSGTSKLSKFAVDCFPCSLVHISNHKISLSQLISLW